MYKIKLMKEETFAENSPQRAMMMAPSDSESGSTRKWRWFKKGEREEVKLKARTSSVEKVGEKGQEGLKDNFTVEGFNKKNVKGDEARKNCTNDTTRDIST